MRNPVYLMTALAALQLGACSKKHPEPAPLPAGGEAARPAAESSAPPPAVAPRPNPAGPDVEQTLAERIHFAYDQWSLTPEAKGILDRKAAALRTLPSVGLVIEGHADERGSDEYNLVLSNQRAAEAKRYLTALGIDPARLATAGFGEERPLDPRSTEAAWSLNRRAEFRVSQGSPAGR